MTGDSIIVASRVDRRTLGSAGIVPLSVIGWGVTLGSGDGTDEMVGKPGGGERRSVGVRLLSSLAI